MYEVLRRGINMKTQMIIPVIIPTFEPDERFLHILSELVMQNIGPLIVVDDGSGMGYKDFFRKAEIIYHTTVLVHEVNKGKGRALKDAFQYCLENWPNMVGCITADSDGQHTSRSIMECRRALLDNPSSLVLGVRNFLAEGKEQIPAKSMFGNRLTCRVLHRLYGIHITDTQTGLRAIPAEFMRYLLHIKGERFEFETQMLIETKREGISICEVPIEIIYDSKDNHSTHFRPIVDSIRIYKLFGAEFGKFMLSGFSSAIVDLTLFGLFCRLLRSGMQAQGGYYIMLATISARLISAVYNYSVNYFLVFKSRKKHIKSILKYVFVAVVQMICSGVFTELFFRLLPVQTELAAKVPIDAILFLFSYIIQRRLVY